MKWSWKLLEVAGIAVYVHATFGLILLWVALAHGRRGGAAVLEGLGFILAIFGCVLLHEFGHALAAKRYGIRTRDITLLPIGGVARLERMPEKPKQELWVALAGPAVNVAIAAALFLLLRVSDTFVPLARLDAVKGPFLERLMIVNVVLVAFNLLPAFPMDGGRLLRALLATRMEYTRATHIAATIGQGMALLFGLLGLVANPFLLFIAFFVWIGAAHEASMVQMRSALSGIPVRRATQTDFRTLAPDDTLGHAVDMILSGSQQDFPVVEDGRPVGVLPRNLLLVALAQRGRGVAVRDVMERDFQVADPSEMLETTFARLQGCRCHTLPVVHEGRLVGILTTENVGEFVMIQTALGARRKEAW